MDEPLDALLLVDLQVDYFNPPELAPLQDELVASANTLTRAALKAGLPVFLITTEHSRDRSTWTLNMLDEGQGFLFHGDPGTDVVPGLEIEQVTRIEKTRDSAFFGTDLDLRLRNLQVGRIVLAGVSSHGCIAQTARDAYAHNVRATVVTDAVAGERLEYHRMALQQLEEDGQADMRTMADVRKTWQTRNPAR